VREARTAALLALAAAIARADSTPPVDKRPAPPAPSRLTLVSIDTTPGKPMARAVPNAPAEQIIVQPDKGQVHITVIRNVEKLDGGTATLTEKEWAEIERTVAEHHLAGWEARPTHQQAFDYPTTRLAVMGNPLPGNVQQWSEPVEGLEHPMALLHLLARLARDKVKSPELHYLTP
jgi:hypothetical protein